MRHKAPIRGIELMTAHEAAAPHHCSPEANKTKVEEKPKTELSDEM